ncbi:MAG: hypothetical protein HGB34_04220 [Candidatus Moranbacteria bacterium]|nr:hypothetical protein [Candidatus Moranbacteria bacterium]
MRRRGAFSVTVDKERASVDEKATRNSRYLRTGVFGSTLDNETTEVVEDEIPVTILQAVRESNGQKRDMIRQSAENGRISMNTTG